MTLGDNSREIAFTINDWQKGLKILHHIKSLIKRQSEIKWVPMGPR